MPEHSTAPIGGEGVARALSPQLRQQLDTLMVTAEPANARQAYSIKSAFESVAGTVAMDPSPTKWAD